MEIGVTTTTHELPFDSLSPRDFERLCLWLVEREGFQRAEHLGAAGSEQGRDIVAYRPTSGGDQLWYFQCKRTRRAGPKTLVREVDKIIVLVEERPELAPTGVVFVTSRDLSAEARRKTRAHCGEQGWRVEFWARTELDQRVWRYPDLVREFFGAGILEAVPPDLDALRVGYLNYLRRRYEYLDLGGIAPRVQNRTVRLRMEDIFVPVQAERELDVRERFARVTDVLLRSAVRHQISGVPTFSIQGLPQRLEEAGIELDGRTWEKMVDWMASSGDFNSLRELLISTAAPRTETATVVDVLSHPRAVVLGHPGTGKTTLLKYAAYAWAVGADERVGEGARGRLPILVRLVEYAKARCQEPTLSLKRYVRECCDPDRPILFTAALRDGDCLVMMDGLDEVRAEERTAVVGEVKALVAEYPDNHFIVTSRIVGYQPGQLTGGFTHFTIGPLPEDSISDFVEKWYTVIEREAGGVEAMEARERAEELCRAIEERPGIRRLTENPLLLTIVALVNWRGRKLPNRRVELYRHAAETLIESWPFVRRGVKMDAEHVMRILAPVAYRIFVDRSSEDISERTLLLLLAASIAEGEGVSGREAKARARELLDQVSAESGFFLHRGYGEGDERMYGFLHATFAEYLAARYLAERWEAEEDDTTRRKFLARYAQIPRWREVLLLMAGIIGEGGRVTSATQVLSDFLQLGSDYEEHLHRDLLLAAECLADDLQVQPQASAYVLRRVADLLVETPIEPLRERIAALAQQMQGTAYEGQIVEHVLARLEDPEAKVRRAAADALGKIRDSRAVEGLLGRLEDSDGWVRGTAARALGEIGDPRAVERLLALLGHFEAWVHWHATLGLKRIGAPGVVTGLLVRLEDPESEVRLATANALGEIGDPQAVEGLLTRLEDSDSDVRRAAAGALGKIRDPWAMQGLLARLEDPEAKVRAAAARALGEIKDPRTGEGLLAHLEDPDTDVRGNAVWALGRIGDSRAAEGLLAGLEDPEAEVRIAAAEALGDLSDPRAVEGLLARLEDPDADVRAAAAWVLGRIKAPRLVEELLARLEHPKARVRQTAIYALVWIRTPQAVKGLLARLKDRAAGVRCAAAEALGWIGNSQAMQELLALLEDLNAEVRAEAAVALGRIGDPRAVEELLAQSEDPDARIRRAAIWALGEIGEPRAVDELVVLLSETDHAFLGAVVRRECDWAYETILEILAKAAPESEPEPARLPPPVPGPWDEAGDPPAGSEPEGE